MALGSRTDTRPACYARRGAPTCDEEGTVGEQRVRQDIAIKQISRRRLLAGMGVGAAGLLVAAACGGTVTPTCPPQNVSQIPGKTSGNDPMNLVFHGSPAGPVSPSFAAEVKGILLNVNHPWDSPGPVHFQLPAVDDYICRSGEATRQDAQAVKTIDWRSRYHVRLWNYDGAAAAVSSAHAETVSLNFHHKVTSFDDGKYEVGRALSEAGWSVQEDSLQVPKNSSPTNNGKATELRR